MDDITKIQASGPITLELLGIAYRKAKVDLYYSSNFSLATVADYEENLYANLTALLQKINDNEEDWVKDPDFTGTWTLAPKSINMEAWNDHAEKHSCVIFTSPAEKWDYLCSVLAIDNPDHKVDKPEAEFRVMAQCSMDFHVMSTLWIIMVGEQFDKKLANCAYGNRLRRTEAEKKLNLFSHGTFQPYLKPFRDWRDNGILAMRDALQKDKKIVALTADVSSFYHKLNPTFINDKEFYRDVLGLALSPLQRKINRLFLSALQSWSHNTPLKNSLPVGLPASAIVANVALIELDRIMQQQVNPLYYGRYVDDIILVMENGPDFKTSEEFWEWLFVRSSFEKNNENKLLGWGADKIEVCFTPRYLNKKESKSEICFSNHKNKVFILSDLTGKVLVDAIFKQIQERTSEWRALPRLPEAPDDINTILLAATQNDGQAADNLRKADALTMRRAGFAIMLRDFEAYERDLLPIEWVEHRHTFFQAFIHHVLTLPMFFDLIGYLPRVIRLAIACEDFQQLQEILNAVGKLCEQIYKCCDLKIKALPECDDENISKKHERYKRWEKTLIRNISENIISALPPKLSQTGEIAWREHFHAFKYFIERKALLSDSIQELQAEHARWFAFDLAKTPFRFRGLPKELVSQRRIPSKDEMVYCEKASELLPEEIITGISKLMSMLGLIFPVKKKISTVNKEFTINQHATPHGILFATRPFSLPELFILGQNQNDYDSSEISDIILALRGFTFNSKAPIYKKESRRWLIPDAYNSPHYNIAVSCWENCNQSWTASVMQEPNPAHERYRKLCLLLDTFYFHPNNCRYLILPELSMPAQWFIYFALKLQSKGISLIAGIEYFHENEDSLKMPCEKEKASSSTKEAEKNTSQTTILRNQVWAALTHDGLGFPSLMIYRQDKQRPALHEELELQRLRGAKLKPGNTWDCPPIIQHGNFHFAILICSELTNIAYRSALRGKIDALFVPEWNQDTETFSALVESAALDIHAYIIQCNARQYGDSRIRAPYKESWKRDILRAKGGETDYCVIGEIDVLKLRQFQSSHRSPDGPFKPVPDGFEIAPERKVLPASD